MELTNPSDLSHHSGKGSKKTQRISRKTNHEQIGFLVSPVCWMGFRSGQCEQLVYFIIEETAGRRAIITAGHASLSQHSLSHLSSLKSFLRTSRALCRKFWIVFPFFICRGHTNRLMWGVVSQQCPCYQTLQHGSVRMTQCWSSSCFTLTVLRCPEPSQ